MQIMAVLQQQPAICSAWEGFITQLTNPLDICSPTASKVQDTCTESDGVVIIPAVITAPFPVDVSKGRTEGFCGALREGERCACGGRFVRIGEEDE